MAVDNLATGSQEEPGAEGVFAPVLELVEVFDDLSTHRLHEIVDRFSALYAGSGLDPHEGTQGSQVTTEQAVERPWISSPCCHNRPTKIPILGVRHRGRDSSGLVRKAPMIAVFLMICGEILPFGIPMLCGDPA